MKRNGMTVPLHRFVVRVRWHARKAGGLFIGLVPDGVEPVRVAVEPVRELVTQ